MVAPLNSFELLDRHGRKIGRAEGSLGENGVPAVRLVTTQGEVIAELAGEEVGQLADLLRVLLRAMR